MTELRRRMIQDMELRGFSPKTRKAYVDAVKGLAAFHHRSPDKLGDEEIRQFFLHLVSERHAARSTVTIYLCGIKFFYEKTLGRELPVMNLVRPRKRVKLPVVLSTSETKELLEQVRHPAYRMALTMIYSCGLRLSEGVHLKVADIDGQRMLVRVENGKGGKACPEPVEGTGMCRFPSARVSSSGAIMRPFAPRPGSFLPRVAMDPATSPTFKRLSRPPCAKAVSGRTPLCIR